jgi:beta-galactosidase
VTHISIIALLVPILLSFAQAEVPADATGSPTTHSSEGTTTVQPPVVDASAMPEAPAVALGEEKPAVWVHQDEDGFQLIHNGVPTLIKGMNWGYMPIGQNYSYDFWGKTDAFITEVLRREMQLLKDMGVNSIRQYDVIPPRWVTWIYDNYGITTMVNNLCGRYGMQIDGAWVPSTNYEDPSTRATIKEQVRASVERYKDTRGVLLWLLGNENNYGLHWSSFEIEALPKDARDNARAKHLYSLYGELVDMIHEMDTEHPVSIANGDLQYIDIIAEEVPHLDILGTNVYRGAKARDLFNEVKAKLNIPVLYSEFGADAYDAKRLREDSVTQAKYLLYQWQEIYEQSHGKGRVGNAIGGYTFQWADGWWKYQQETNLDIHDNNASWPNGGYVEDFVAGQNNMNEEWFGICAKGVPDETGHFDVYPRPAYYSLKQAYTLPVYSENTTLEAIQSHFATINPKDYTDRYDAQQLKEELRSLQRFSISGIRFEQSNFLTKDTQEADIEPNGQQFDHMETLFVNMVGEPTENVRTEVSLSILGHTPQNRMDELFYEAAGTPVQITDTSGESIYMDDFQRLRLYRATLNWNSDKFNMQGFYRQGHYHWGDKGDFFGLYREAYYGPNIDIYNADVPIGVEVEAKKKLEGLRFAFGPQIYWGANPQVIALYTKRLGQFDFSVAHQEDIAAQTQTGNSQVMPEQMTRKSTLYTGFNLGRMRLELGGIASGTNKIGRAFTRVIEADSDENSYANSGYHVVEDQIQAKDVFGGRVRAQTKVGPVQWFAQGGYQGLVADGGEDRLTVLTGWQLKPSGSGNQTHIQSGMTLALGWLQIAPNFLWQKPLVGPNPGLPDVYDPDGLFYSGIKPRNVVVDPFQVIGNRETIGGELLLVWDPTPGTWFWYWDNPQREDAVIAASLDIIYRHQPTTRDANIAFTENGGIIQFDASPAAHDVWSVDSRVIANPGKGLHIVTNSFVGQYESTGSDDRIVLRYGITNEFWWKTQAVTIGARFDDWGPYDYHRVFNLTYPLQIDVDYSFGIGAPTIDWNRTRLVLQGKYRTRDEFSWGSEAVTALSGADYEWELGTRLIFEM